MSDEYYYQCRTCGNIALHKQRCHNTIMESLCSCGSGKFATECSFHKKDIQSLTASS